MKQWLRASFGLDPVRFFIVVAAAFGLIFLLVTPPFQGADEVVHFYRAYQVSEGNFVSDTTKAGVGGAMPASLGKVIIETDTPAIQFYPNLKYDEHKTKAALEIPNQTNKKVFYDFPAAASYSPIPYVASSSAILVTRVLHLPTLVSLYAARLGNLILWIALVGLAIYFMPRRKWALVAVGLLPMALFQAATLNGDVLTVGSLVLFVSLILHFKDRKTLLTKWNMLSLLAVATAMLLSKQIMFVFLPLLLLLRNKLFESRRAAIIAKTALIIVPLAMFGLWMHIIHNINISGSYFNHQDPTAQLHFVLRNPGSYINVLWNTYFYTWGDGVTRSFIGTFGWADTPLSEAIVVLGYIGLAILFVATTQNKFKPLLDKREKQLFLIVGVLYWLAVSTSLYLYYSPVGFKIVYGLQGRYYIPLAVLAVPLLQSMKVRFDEKLYHRVALYLPTLLLVASTITLYVRYFVHNV